MKIEQQQNSMQ